MRRAEALTRNVIQDLGRLGSSPLTSVTQENIEQIRTELQGELDRTIIRLHNRWIQLHDPDTKFTFEANLEPKPNVLRRTDAEGI